MMIRAPTRTDLPQPECDTIVAPCPPPVPDSLSGQATSLASVAMVRDINNGVAYLAPDCDSVEEGHRHRHDDRSAIRWYDRRVCSGVPRGSLEPRPVEDGTPRGSVLEPFLYVGQGVQGTVQGTAISPSLWISWWHSTSLHGPSPSPSVHQQLPLHPRAGDSGSESSASAPPTQRHEFCPSSPAHQHSAYPLRTGDCGSESDREEIA